MWGKVIAWLAVALALVPRLASAQSDLAPFEPRFLGYEDIRFLQAALIVDGSYRGPLDGEWGLEEQAALAAALPGLDGRAITFGDLRPLLTEFEKEREVSQWRVYYFPSNNSSQLLPDALLASTGAETDPHVTLENRDGSLLVRTLFANTARTLELHNWLAEHHRAPAPYSRAYTEQSLVTRATFESGRVAHLWSLPDAGYYVSTLVQYDTWQAGRGELIVASLQDGNQPELELPETSLLRVYLDAAPEVGAALPGLGSPRAAEARLGSGFFVNTTDIVTAAHVVDGCERLELDNGTHLQLIARDPERDLAVLSAPGRAGRFLPLSRAATPLLGETIYALGFPYRALLEQGLTVTSGNVSAMPGPRDPARKIMLSAPIQPGNSGGPVLNRAGEVIGMVVSRADELAYLEKTGTLPQNLNFAVSVRPILEFLGKADVRFPLGTERARPILNGIPVETQTAVAAILCF
ncbi:S1C family serine protease [Litorisediminicola beolgyonensis]|uniref:S1C family serine protease n=1 Tax=Litorisediminicola beolgyonensis TaxID=1173614 RepID=A0ABW3ZIG6_9RHOB